MQCVIRILDDLDACTWKGTWADLPTHLQHCDYVEVPCTWKGCEDKIQRRFSQDHHEKCTCRIVSCEYCKLPLMHKLLKVFLLIMN